MLATWGSADDAERALESARLGCHWGSPLYSRGDERCVAWRTVQVGAKSLNMGFTPRYSRKGRNLEPDLSRALADFPPMWLPATNVVRGVCGRLRDGPFR